ncbi:hypothetical protein G6F43_001372 [Rhizopus delemar]|nr:hypothetical protein G6F43_001372 [Rhizopus delemar]
MVWQWEDNKAHHLGLLELCNILKDEIDLLLMEDCPEEIPVFGILIGGYGAAIYVIDLVYTHLYRSYEAGSFHIPSSITDLSRLDRALDSLVMLMNQLFNLITDMRIYTLERWLSQNTIVTSISAASINQQTHAEPTTTTISTSTSTSTPTPTELRPDKPTATELVLAEDKSEAVWRTSLKRSIEALEVDLKQKELEAHSIKKKLKY